MADKKDIGGSINRGLRAFNNWFDDFVLEASKPLAILGFIMGTVDIYTRGGIATQPAFYIPWSIVQALVIDGLFFAVWWRFFAAKWEKKWGRVLSNVGLLLIGLLLSVVAFLTNMILGFQQLWGVSDSMTAMTRLGIDPVKFTITRAALVVLVTIMVSFTYYKSHPEINTKQQSDQRDQPAHIEIREVDRNALLLLPPVTTLERLTGARDQLLREGEKVDIRAIAAKSGLSYNTARKYKKELGI